MKYTKKSFQKLMKEIWVAEHVFKYQWAYEESYINNAIEKGTEKEIDIQLRSSFERLKEIKGLYYSMKHFMTEVSREEKELNKKLKTYGLNLE